MNAETSDERHVFESLMESVRELRKELDELALELEAIIREDSED